MNIELLHKLTNVPWAVDQRTLPLVAQMVAAGKAPIDRGEPTESAAMQIQRGYCPLNWESAMCANAQPPLPANVSVVMAWGMLGRGWTVDEKAWLDCVEVDELVAAVRASTAETTVIWWRSPGGITTGVPESAEALRELASERRIISFTDDMCCSAAYWLAAQTGAIHATHTAAVGSIGVYIAMYDYSRFLSSAGIDLKLFKAGRLKATGIAGAPLSEEASEMLQARVDESYSAFVRAVTDNRLLDREAMQGQTFCGQASLSVNLVDELQRSAFEFFNRLV